MATVRRATLKDVAREAGVSVTTASVALNGLRDGVRVGEEARERVLAAAAELDYRPNPLARSLRTQRTATIGFVSDEVTTTPFAVAMLAAAQDEAARRGHLLFVVNLGPKAPSSLTARVLDLLAAQQPVGIIRAAMFHQIVDVPPHLPARSVFLNCRTKRPGYRCIVPDDEQGAYDATLELIKAGHERIAFVDAKVVAPASGLRLRGHQRALRDAGIRPRPELHISVPPYVRGGREAIGLVDLPAAQRPTAFFCFNDRLAMGLFQALRARDLQVPQDFSVVGFDDQEFIASELDPPLTTMRLPHADMGRRAVELLLDADPPNQRRPGDDLVVLEPCPLVSRDSVGPPR